MNGLAVAGEDRVIGEFEDGSESENGLGEIERFVDVVGGEHRGDAATTLGMMALARRGRTASKGRPRTSGR
jgi:hypothetical protein